MADKLDLTAFDKLFKDVYLPPIREQFNTSNILLTRIKKSSDGIDAAGRRAIFPILLGYSQGIGSRGEYEDLPKSRGISVDTGELKLAYHYASIHITTQTMRLSRKDVGAFARALDFYMQNILDGFTRDIQRQLYGNGTGSLGTITTAVAIPANTPTDVDVSSTLYMSRDMVVELWNSTFTTQRTAGGSPIKLTITKIVDDNTITVVSSTAIAATDYASGDHIVREGVVVGGVSREMNGIDNVVSDTGILANIDPTVIPEWKSQVLTGLNTANMIQEMQKSYTYCEKQGATPSLIITTYEMRDTYANQLFTLRRWTGDYIVLDGGFKAIEFNGQPVVADFLAPAKKIFFLVEKNLVIYQIDQPDWLDEDGHVLKWDVGKDAWKAVLYWYANFTTVRRNSHAKQSYT